MNKKILLSVFAVSGFIPLLLVFNKDTTLLIYSLFVLIYFLRPNILPIVSKIPLAPLAKVFIFTLLFGLLSETLFWFGTYISGTGEEGFNQYLSSHLSTYLGFYFSKAIAWTLVLHFFRFSLAQVFITQGLIGAVIEQQGAVFMQALANPLTVIWAFYVVPVYASYVAIAYLLAFPKDYLQPRRDHLLKYPLIFFLTLLIMFVMSVIKEL